MKKLFTLIAVAFMAVCAQAQEKVLFASDGTYGNGATLTTENTKLVLGNDRTTKNYNVKLATAKAYCADMFGQQVMVKNEETGEMEEKTRIVYVVGDQNPKDGELDGDKSAGSGYKPASCNLPQSGTYYMITPSKDGHITAYIVLNADKNLYVAKASDGSCLSVSELTIKRDAEEAEVVELNEEYKVDEKVNGTLEFNVVANETYYVFCAGSKLSFGGYIFEEFGEVEPKPEGEQVPIDITSGWSTWQDSETIDYNADGTLTFNSAEWGGLAKWLGGRDLSGYDYLVVEYAEPTTVITQLLVQFSTEEVITKQANPGATYLFIDLNDERSTAVNQIALQTASPSTIKIAAIYYIKKPGGEEPPVDGEKVSLMDNFNYNWNNDAESIERTEDGSIIYNSAEWGGLAGWFANEEEVPADWSNYIKLVFEFAEPTTVNTQILVSDGENNVASAWGDPGIKKLECSFAGKDVSKVKQCALQTEKATTLKITAIYLVKAGGSTPADEEGWVELVKNGDVEGDDGTSLLTKNGDGDGGFIFNPVAGAGVDGSRAAVVHAVSNAVNEWDSQFFIYAPDHVFAAGETYKVSFKVRADKATSVSVQAHKQPGTYLHWAVITDGSQINITPEWKEITYEGVATEDMKEMQTIAFNLNQDKTLENNYYFDNISWKLKVDTEGVKEINTPKQMNGQRYNLAGMRVSDDYKGIVIQNGRKFIQK